MNAKNKALENVLNDKDFLENVIKMDIESARKAFENRAVKLTEDDMATIKELVCRKIERSKYTSDEMLQKVSGGRTPSEKLKNIAYAISSLIIAGTVAGLGYKAYETLEKVNHAIDDASAQSVVKTVFWGLPGRKKENQK